MIQSVIFWLEMVKTWINVLMHLNKIFPDLADKKCLIIFGRNLEFPTIVLEEHEVS